MPNPIDMDRVNATTANGVVVNLEEYKARAMSERATSNSLRAPVVQVASVTGMLFALALLLFVFGFARR